MAKNLEQRLLDKPAKPTVPQATEPTCVAFAVLVERQGDKTMYRPVKIQLEDGIVVSVEPTALGETMPYEPLAYEHVCTAVMEHYVQKQVNEARDIGRTNAAKAGAR